MDRSTLILSVIPYHVEKAYVAEIAETTRRYVAQICNEAHLSAILMWKNSHVAQKHKKTDISAILMWKETHVAQQFGRTQSQGKNGHVAGHWTPTAAVPLAVRYFDLFGGVPSFAIVLLPFSQWKDVGLFLPCWPGPGNHDLQRIGEYFEWVTWACIEGVKLKAIK